MDFDYFIVCLFGISTCFVVGTAALEGIIGGYKADVDQFPYLVSVQQKEIVQICGGAVIGERFILTAAHCVITEDDKFQGNYLSIIAGTNDLRKIEKPAMVVKVKKVYVPWAYKFLLTRAVGDVAVLKLEHPLEMSRHIQKLELPKHDHGNYTIIKAEFAGFGWDWIQINGNKEEGGNTDTQLRYAEVEIIRYQQCAKDRGLEIMPDHFICAKVKIHDESKIHGACYGDSGGPLVHGRTVIGILSHAPRGCKENIKPSVYVDVSYYLDFIDDAIHNRKSLNMRIHDVKH